MFVVGSCIFAFVGRIKVLFKVYLFMRSSCTYSWGYNEIFNYSLIIIIAYVQCITDNFDQLQDNRKMQKSEKICRLMRNQARK